MSAIIWGEGKQQGENREKILAICLALIWTGSAITLLRLTNWDQHMNSEIALSKYLYRNTHTANSIDVIAGRLITCCGTHSNLCTFSAEDSTNCTTFVFCQLMYGGYFWRLFLLT